MNFEITNEKLKQFEYLNFIQAKQRGFIVYAFFKENGDVKYTIKQEYFCAVRCGTKIIY